MARINHGQLVTQRSAATRVAARSQRGFSLIELLIVVAIILIVAAIAIPNFLRARMAANEAGAVQSLRAIATAQVVYQTTYGLGYADTLTKLGGNSAVPADQNGAHILDWLLGCAAQPCNRTGYKFEITNTTGIPPTDYVATGVPTTLHKTGENGYCSSQSNLLMVDPTGGPNCTITLNK